MNHHRATYKPSNVQRSHNQNKHDGASSASAKYRKHIDPNYCDSDGRTHLHAIADQIWNDDVAIDNAVKDGCDVNAVDNHGCRPIHYAAEKGHAGCVTALIKHGADSNPVSKVGHSPLMTAARLGFGEVIKVLLHAGAKVVCYIVTYVLRLF